MSEPVTHYSGPIGNMFAVDQEGEPMFFKGGPHKDKPYRKIGIKVNDEWVNIIVMSPDHWPLAKKGNEVMLSYTTNPQGFHYLKSIEPAGATQSAHNGAPGTSGSHAPSQGGEGHDRNESIREQTCIKCATEVICAEISAVKGTKFEFSRFVTIYQEIKGTLNGITNELDLAMHVAKESGMTEEKDEEKDEEIEFPGPAADEFKGTF